MKTFFLIVFIFFSSILSAQQVIEVIELKSQLPENIVPVIKPLLGSRGTATSMNNRLILKVEADQLNEIRRLVDQLDRPPHAVFAAIAARQAAGAAGAEINLTAALVQLLGDLAA